MFLGGGGFVHAHFWVFHTANLSSNSYRSDVDIYPAPAGFLALSSAFISRPEKSAAKSEFTSKIQNSRHQHYTCRSVTLMHYHHHSTTAKRQTQKPINWCREQSPRPPWQLYSSHCRPHGNPWSYVVFSEKYDVALLGFERTAFIGNCGLHQLCINGHRGPDRRATAYCVSPENFTKTIYVQFAASALGHMSEEVERSHVPQTRGAFCSCDAYEPEGDEELEGSTHIH